MNLFRKKRAPPTNMIEVERSPERAALRQSASGCANANTINRLLETIDALAAAVPAGSLDPSLEKRVHDAARFKTLNAITDIDLADPGLAESWPLAVLRRVRILSRFLRRRRQAAS